MEYHLAPATRLPFGDRRFDLTLLYNCLMGIEDAEAALVEAAGVTAPGVRVIVSVVHPIADLHADGLGGATQGLDCFANRDFDLVNEVDGLSMPFAG